MADERTQELLERLICLELHYRGVPQQNIALFPGENKAYINVLLKPLAKKGGDDR
jgi:hypothetical protein